mgnify:CR=1 FL=1
MMPNDIEFASFIVPEDGPGWIIDSARPVMAKAQRWRAGEIGRAPGTTSVVEGGAGPQTRQIFENYEATLEKLGSGLEDIVKCTVFLEDMANYAAINEAYAAAFPGNKPARSTMGVDGLALGAAVEIECLAVKS